jgi:hypothetical protein
MLAGVLVLLLVEVQQELLDLEVVVVQVQVQQELLQEPMQLGEEVVAAAHLQD